MTPRLIHPTRATSAETFALINRYQSDNPHHGIGFRQGQFFEIEETEYWYFFEVMPPLHSHLGSFAMSEFTRGNFTESFHEISGRFWAMLIAYSQPYDVERARHMIVRHLRQQASKLAS